MSKQHDNGTPAHGKLRVDKWLWAARFFKTRSLAKAAIDGGKVHCNGERCKSSRELGVGNVLTIRQGFDERTVVVKALDDHRRGAPEAARLYEETPESIVAREKLAAERKAMHVNMQYIGGRPTKQGRRHIHRFKQELYRDDE